MERLLYFLFRLEIVFKGEIKRDKNNEWIYHLFLIPIISLITLILLLTKGFAYLTRYYPFSLFCRNKLFHYHNRYINKLLDIIDFYTIATGNQFEIIIGDQDNYFCYLIGVFKKKPEDSYIEDLKTKIGKEHKSLSGNIYFKTDEEGIITISAPIDSLKTVYQSTLKAPFINRFFSIP